jgi:hypothetical protein
MRLPKRPPLIAPPRKVPRTRSRPRFQSSILTKATEATDHLILRGATGRIHHSNDLPGAGIDLFVVRSNHSVTRKSLPQAWVFFTPCYCRLAENSPPVIARWNRPSQSSFQYRTRTRIAKIWPVSFHVADVCRYLLNAVLGLTILGVEQYRSTLRNTPLFGYHPPVGRQTEE